MTDRKGVREGRPDDLPTLQAIQVTVLAEPWQELLAVAVDGPPMLLVATERSGADGSSETQNTPVGYALGVSDGDDEAAYLAELAVAPDHQGSGHGTALLDALVGRLVTDGVDALRVTVRASDGQAQAFYLDRGFEQRERITDHYETGDGLLLARDISE